jgi:hypothetical protein
MTPLLLLALSVPPGLTEFARGPLSFYWPNDGSTPGKVLACDTPCRPRRYHPGAVHVAMRGVRREFPCGTAVLVCSEQTGRCAVAPVFDAGPWGIVREGVRRTWRSRRAPRGWRFRGVVDLSREVWRRLGKPKFLSTVRIYR